MGSMVASWKFERGIVLSVACGLGGRLGMWSVVRSSGEIEGVGFGGLKKRA